MILACSSADRWINISLKILFPVAAGNASLMDDNDAQVDALYEKTIMLKEATNTMGDEVSTECTIHPHDTTTIPFLQKFSWIVGEFSLQDTHLFLIHMDPNRNHL